ncbi:MAG: hypothetical protein LWW92_10115, partial [Rhodocyclales bacterium]|nr:hypothetical protein [Rhodocyclales bacterium]
INRLRTCRGWQPADAVKGQADAFGFAGHGRCSWVSGATDVSIAASLLPILTTPININQCPKNKNLIFFMQLKFFMHPYQRRKTRIPPDS